MGISRFGRLRTVLRTEMAESSFATLQCKVGDVPTVPIAI
jgi:hypothetical protein